MEGIRLRSDSTGSAKSAFYQGIIVSTPLTVDTSNATENRQNRRNAGRHRSKGTQVANDNGMTKDSWMAESTGNSFTSSNVAPLPKGGLNRPSLQFRTKLVTPVAKGYLPMRDFHDERILEIAGMVDNERDGRLKNGLQSKDPFLQVSSHVNRGPFGTSNDAISSKTGGQNFLLGTNFLEDSLRDDAFSLNNDLDMRGDSGSSNVFSLPESATQSDLSDVSTGSGTLFRMLYSGSRGPDPVLSNPVQHSKTPQQQSYGTNPCYGTDARVSHPYSSESLERIDSSCVDSTSHDNIDEDVYEVWDESATLSERLVEFLNPTEWLLSNVKCNEDGTPFFDKESQWTLPGFVRTVLYNPIYPEFTSLQQFSWAVIIGIFMGVYTALWKALIEACVDFMWKDIPEKLLEWGVFTNTDGTFPIYHYMWIVPCIFGGVLSYIFASLPTPIPGQNDWIHNLHSRGVQSSETFGLLFILSTAGMASGLSLGPELPLILTSGMIGSWLGVLCKQSMLQARVLNLTAASAAIGGFFGFPMAGALFVLEVPHRMGLQYFEALSPATIASIVAVLTNRLVTGNDVTGYYEYPFLNDTLPSQIFKDAIVYGLFGGALGIFYTRVVVALKHFVHELFHDAHHNEKEPSKISGEELDEMLPLVGEMKPPAPECCTLAFLGFPVCIIPHRPTRAALSGSIVGAIVGITCIFIPHVMFWGEAQLQSMIDKGRTPLPVFGHGDDPTAGLVALGYCMVDRENTESSKLGFSLGCSAAITLAKIFVTGLSLGTGIVGGHFWAPLFVGCAASHFLTDLVHQVSTILGFRCSLSAYPCVALLCIMGSCHVVTFRAHIAIILILTLTIDAFDPEDKVGGAFKVAGDYSAVFPLLTVAVFVALQISRQTIFYEKQRSRGDIMALPEVLCEPGKEGKPLVMDYEGNVHKMESSDYNCDSDSDDQSLDERENYRRVDGGTTQKDIEAQFEARNRSSVKRFVGSAFNKHFDDQGPIQRPASVSSSDGSAGRASSPLPPRPQLRKTSPVEENGQSLSVQGLDDLLNGPIDNVRGHVKSHRRTRSLPLNVLEANSASMSLLDRKTEQQKLQTLQRKMGAPAVLKRVSSFGQVDQEQPSLLDQARRRAASFAMAESSPLLKHKAAFVGSPASGRPVRKHSMDR